MKIFHLKAVILLCVGLAIAPVAMAKDVDAKVLDAKAANSLLSDRTWQVKKIAASGFYYKSWKSDGSVCIRLESKTSKCDDTGRWKLDGERLCYELTWWGEGNGLRSACFRISDKGKGQYNAVQDNGLTLFEFSVAK